jgi:hypothetical protein
MKIAGRAANGKHLAPAFFCTIDPVLNYPESGSSLSTAATSCSASPPGSSCEHSDDRHRRTSSHYPVSRTDVVLKFLGATMYDKMSITKAWRSPSHPGGRGVSDLHPATRTAGGRAGLEPALDLRRSEPDDRLLAALRGGWQSRWLRVRPVARHQSQYIHRRVQPDLADTDRSLPRSAFARRGLGVRFPSSPPV